MREPVRRFAIRAAVVLLALTGISLVTAPSGDAAEESFARPVSGVFQVTGHGFGHGRGMSQYGARGAATLGVAWSDILTTYYPGTTRQSSTGRVRVKVSTLDANQITVGNAFGLLVTLGDSGTQIWRGSEVLGYRVTMSATGMRLDSFDGTTYLPIPGAESVTGSIRFDNAAKVHRVWKTNGTSRTYRGVIEVRRGATGLDAIVDLPLEDYLRGVVPAEMPASWPAEALKAQSVAARSYAARARASAAAVATYDICDTDACQVFAGTASYSSSGVATQTEDPRSDAAIVATSGTVLSYAGAVALTEFSSSNGGWTVASSLPYQVARADPWDNAAPNPHTTWNATLPASQVEARYPSIGTLSRMVIVGRTGTGEWGGRVRSVRFEGSAGSVTVSGESVVGMRPFGAYSDGFRSTWFTVSQKTDPLGQLDAATATTDGVSFSGWAIDPETSASIDVHVYVDNGGRAVTANLSRPDVGAAYPGFGSQHGYSGWMPALAGHHTVCAYGINVQTGVGYNPLLGCKPVRVPGSTPYGEFRTLTASVGTVAVSGWAVDPDTTAPIDVHVYVDAVGYAVRSATPRADVATLLPVYGAAHGFDAVLPASPGQRRVCVYAINSGPGAGNNPVLGCRDIWVFGTTPFGQVDSVAATAGEIGVQGWTIDPDTAAPIDVHVYVDNVTMFSTTANVVREDVAAVYPDYSARHGFALAVPASRGPHTVCAYAINVLSGAGNNPSLGCRSVTVP